MKKTTSVVLLVAGAVILGTANRADAQTPPISKRIFADVNFGVQPQSRTFSVEVFPIVYGETAIVRSNQGIDGAGLFDVLGGYRVWRDLSVGIGLTRTFTTKNRAEVTGAIPHPLYYDTRVESTETLEDLEHHEQSAHLFVMWTSPVTDKIDASVSFGPTYVKVFQQLVNNISVPPGTQEFTPLADEQTATTWGFHFGGDVTLLITRNIGVGGMIRYVKATVDLPAVTDLDAAGFQVGGGVRLRF